MDLVGQRELSNGGFVGLSTKLIYEEDSENFSKLYYSVAWPWDIARQGNAVRATAVEAVAHKEKDRA